MGWLWRRNQLYIETLNPRLKSTVTWYFGRGWISSNMLNAIDLLSCFVDLVQPLNLTINRVYRLKELGLVLSSICRVRYSPYMLVFWLSWQATPKYWAVCSRHHLIYIKSLYWQPTSSVHLWFHVTPLIWCVTVFPITQVVHNSAVTRMFSEKRHFSEQSKSKGKLLSFTKIAIVVSENTSSIVK